MSIMSSIMGLKLNKTSKQNPNHIGSILITIRRRKFEKHVFLCASQAASGGDRRGYARVVVGDSHDGNSSEVRCVCKVVGMSWRGGQVVGVVDGEGRSEWLVLILMDEVV